MKLRRDRRKGKNHRRLTGLIILGARVKATMRRKTSGVDARGRNSRSWHRLLITKACRSGGKNREGKREKEARSIELIGSPNQLESKMEKVTTWPGEKVQLKCCQKSPSPGAGLPTW